MFQLFADPTELFPTLSDLANVVRIDYALTATATIVTDGQESTVTIQLPITAILNQKEETAWARTSQATRLPKKSNASSRKCSR